MDKYQSKISSRVVNAIRYVGWPHTPEGICRCSLTGGPLDGRAHVHRHYTHNDGRVIVEIDSVDNGDYLIENTKHSGTYIRMEERKFLEWYEPVTKSVPPTTKKVSTRIFDLQKFCRSL